MVQAVPLSVNAVGAGLVPVWVPLNPIVVEPPLGPSVRFQSRLVAVTLALPAGWAHTALHPGSDTRCPAVKLNAKVHPLTAEAPVFVIVTDPVNPFEPPQLDAE